MKNFIACILLLLTPNFIFAKERIVSASAFATEILYALGLEEEIVGVDLTSQYPKQAMEKPQIGYKRTLTPEGILSLKPTVIVADTSSGPKHTLDALQSYGVKIVTIAEVKNISDMNLGVEDISKHFNKNNTPLLNQINTLTKQIQKSAKGQKIAFISRHGGRTEAGSGTDTIQNEIITLLGGKNAFNYNGTRPINKEAMIALKPKYVIYSTLEVLDDNTRKEITSSPMYSKSTVIFVQSIPLLSFGPASLNEIISISKQIK